MRDSVEIHGDHSRPRDYYGRMAQVTSSPPSPSPSAWGFLAARFDDPRVFQALFIAGPFVILLLIWLLSRVLRRLCFTEPLSVVRLFGIALSIFFSFFSHLRFSSVSRSSLHYMCIRSRAALVWS
jgi:hypothetical protein